MSIQQTTPKQWFALAILIFVLLTGLTLCVATIWLGWSGMLLIDLPLVFWILYALFITSSLTLIILPADNSAPPEPLVNSPSSLITLIIQLLPVLALGWLAITEQQWNATKLLGLTAIIFFFFLGGQKLLNYLRTRGPKQL